MNLSKMALGVALVAMIIAIGGYFYPQIKTTVGAAITGPAHLQLESFWYGVQLGQRGTPLSLYASGNCTLKSDFSIAATSTSNVSCTGITLQNGATYTGAAGDIIDVQLAASTTLAAQYLVRSAQASTTVTGSIELQLFNQTGKAATPSATPGFGSTTQYQIYR